MVYACTALNAPNKTQRHRLEVIQNCCLRYTRRVVDSTCTFNDELRSRCNTARVEQRILALANNWWRKISVNHGDVANSTYHHQTNTDTKTL